MALTIRTHLMFDGSAEEAMNFYVNLFNDAEIISIERYGADEDGREGSVKKADFTLCGHPLICIDSTVKHKFTFTPAISLFVDCENKAELEKTYNELSTDGEILMPLGNYGFSQKFGWVNDCYGVSWQLNLQE